MRITSSECRVPSPDLAAPLGLIAGEGEFPRLVARGARAAARGVVIVGIRGSADPDLRELADRFTWRGVAQVGRWIRFFRKAGVREVVMAGRVRKAQMFAGPRWLQYLRYLPDLTSIRVWYRHARDKRNDTLLGAVADELGRRGLTLIDSTRYCPEALAPAGLLTPGCPPSPAVLADVAFAWPIAREIARLDVGQAVAVKEQEIIAVEAIEGTDALIERAGALCRQGGWTLVKLAKPQQDMRFDVPTVGPQTIENLQRARAAALFIEAGRTLVLERERLVAAAERAGIAVVGYAG
ncbi:MAG: UDP-2,3-diacylglucosamine diphosphatase LpxI [Planctomycetota bacterium]